MNPGEADGDGLAVVFDAHMIGARETGNETYAEQLVAALDGLGPRRVTACLGRDAALPASWRGLRHVQVSRLRRRQNLHRLVRGLPALCRSRAAQVLHVTYTGPFLPPCPTVVAVHDVSFRLFPRWFSVRDRVLFRTLVPASLRRAAAVITLSEASRRDLLRFYPRLEGRVHVTPAAAAPRFHPPAEGGAVDEVCRRYRLPRPYLLFVGAAMPRKNLPRLLAAFQAVREQVTPAPSLVIAGTAFEAGRTPTLRALVAAGAVSLTGYLPAEQLPTLYAGAAAFVFPSLYEGFGLPVLEAMACGAPVISSTAGAVPEVAGDAALLVEPTDTAALCEAIRAVLARPDLAAGLRARGLARARGFTWERTAERTWAVYRAVAPPGNRST